MSAALKHEIAQQRPFASPQEEALLNLMRTADCLNRAFHLTVRKWGITSTQYNVLRILRGAHPEGLACSTIGARMITSEPDITRLLARLKTLGHVSQRRDRRDRRVVLTCISPKGLELLKEMDPTISAMPGQLLGHLKDADLDNFIRLLELARHGCDPHPTEPACNGASSGPTCDGTATS